MLFRDIIGQQEIKSLLRSNVASQHIAHAIYLAGRSGIGKLRLAIAYLQYLNCDHKHDGESCGKCVHCRMFEDFAHPNMYLIYPIVKSESTKQTTCADYFESFQHLLKEREYFDLQDWITVLGTENKQVRIFENESSQIADFLSKPSFNRGYKGIIIWQPDKMNDVFANKILKMLEEPPQRMMFIFVGEHPEWLLPTIQSRVQIINVPPLTQEDITHYFSQKTDTNNLPYLVKMARGSILRAEKVLNENEQHSQFFSFFTSLMRNAWLVAVKKNYSALLHLREWSLEIAENKQGREYQKAFLQYAQTQLRENYIYNYHTPQLNYLSPQEEAFSQRFAPFIHKDNVETLMLEFDKAETQITQNGNAKIIFFDLCLQCIVQMKEHPQK